MTSNAEVTWQLKLHTLMRVIAGDKPNWIKRKLLGITARLYLKRHPVPPPVFRPPDVDADELSADHLPRYCCRKNTDSAGGTFILRHKKRRYVIVAHAKSVDEIHNRFGKNFSVVAPPIEMVSDPKFAGNWASSMAAGGHSDLYEETIKSWEKHDGIAKPFGEVRTRPKCHN